MTTGVGRHFQELDNELNVISNSVLNFPDSGANMKYTLNETCIKGM